MKAHIYKQDYYYDLKHNNVLEMDVNPEDMYAQRECQDCGGTGIFELPDGDKITCVTCKGSGKRWLNLI